MDILFLEDAEDQKSSQGQSAAELSNGALLSELQETLRKLRQALHTAVLGSRSGSKEARLWLTNSIAGLELSDTATKRRRFTQYLPGGTSCRGAEHAPLGRAMLQLLFESHPTEVGALVAQDAPLLRHFFKADPARVPLWFGHFSMDGMRSFKYGAAALGQYALGHRGEVWDLLAWRGRHPQAPIAVAQRTHYFCELDVPRTLRHLIRDVPAFWGSREMRQSVEVGAAQLLALDPPFWSQELLLWLEDRHSSRADQLYALLCRSLEGGSWRQHCQRMLHLLPQQDLLSFSADLLGGTPFSPGSASSKGGACNAGQGAATAAAAAAAAAEAAAAAVGPAQPGAWLVFCGVQWQSLDQLLLASALGCCLPLLLRLLRDDEMADERQEVQLLVRQLLQLDQPPERQAAAVAAHWRLRRQLRQQRSEGAAVELREMLLLHLFAAAFLMHELASSSNASDTQQLQGLLTASGFPCQLQQPGDGSVQGRRSGRKRKERRREGRSGKRSKGKKGKRQQRGRSNSPGDSGSSIGDSDPEADSGGRGEIRQSGSPWLAFEAEGAAEQAQEHLWQLSGRQHGGSSGGSTRPRTVSSLELRDAVAGATAFAYASWLLG